MIRQVVRHNDDATVFTTSAQEDEKKVVTVGEEEYVQAVVEPVEETLSE